jgi:exodeoxyribonuclease-5
VKYSKEAITIRFGVPVNDQQVKAINDAVEWFAGYQDKKHRRIVFFLAGYGGTGKTTIAKIIAELCCGIDHVKFLAPTGKAASRLKQKGCGDTKTLHQFIYNVRGEDEDGEIIFVAKGALDEKPKLIILDEASMVGEYDRDKILLHRIPLLAIGDPGQVPPVKAKQVFCLGTQDVLLDQIERNAGNIVRASMFVRQGYKLPLREYDDVVVRAGRIPDDHLLTFTGEDGVVICSYNKTRQLVNTRIRKLLGFTGQLPGVGEKLVCTSNQHGYGIMNGEQGVVISYEPIPEGSEDQDEPADMLLLNYRSLTDGKIRMAKFNPLSFDRDEDTAKEAQKSPGGFDFGWTLTVHKSQGSEWSRALVIEETLRGVPYNQMMYTAVTRAIDFLSVNRP